MIKMADNIKIELINSKELLILFNELTPKIQDKIINTGMKNAGKLILNEAKRLFKTIRKNKSKTNYSGFSGFFGVKTLRKKDGIILGVKNYKYRFINYGTNERNYKTKNGNHKTGKIEKTLFFTNAVENKKDAAMKNIQNSITSALEKTVEKYNKKYRL